MKKFKIIISIFLILIVTLAAFYPSLKNNFTNWDDDLYVTGNSAIRSITLANLKNISTSFFATHYQPVTILSYLLEYHFFKLNPFNYHLTNLILHLLNCLLVFWVIYLLTGRISVACLTALLFGIHPMQVESVAWISERKNVLYAFFFLGAMTSYLYYLRKEKALKYYFFCLSLFILALLSKSMAMTLPLVLLGLDYFTSRKINPAVFIEKIPYFFLSLIFGLIPFLGGYLSKSVYTYTISTYGLLTRLKGISHDIIFYLNKLCFPVRLSALYPYAEIKNNPLHLYSLVAVIILLAGIIISRRYSKKVILGSGLFLMMVFPVIRFLPLEEILAADRYIYLPAIGIFYLFAEGFIWLYRRRAGYYHFTRIFLVIVLAAVVIFLGCSTWKRSRVWKDSLSLWNDVLENYPDIFLPYKKRGEYLFSQGEYEKARSDFITALNLDSNCCEAYFNLAILCNSSGNYNDAIRLANKALQINPAYLKTYNLLTVLYGKIGKHSVAIDICKNLIKIKPDSVEAYFNLCSAYGNLGNFQEAIVYGEKAVAINPSSALAHSNLSAAYYYTKQYDLAIKHCDQAIKLGYKVSPEFLEALKNTKHDRRE